MQVSIVIPVYNALAVTRQCVTSIYTHGAAIAFEVIVVDNGSTGDVAQWAQAQQREQASFCYLRYPEPLGFARAVNAGAAAATGEVLIVLNSDTIVTAEWMDELHRELLRDPSLGALSPVTNHAGEPAQMDFGVIELPAARAIDAFSKRPRKPCVFYLPQRITFFCVALRREVWEQFHGLDEAYQIGNFEDDDLCLRLRVAGYRLGVMAHVFVYHHNNATFTANKISHEGWMTKNAALFAAHARAFAEADSKENATALRRPRGNGSDISVVILPSAEGPLERTLQSLANQTVSGFEVLGPGDTKAPTRSWIAYLNEGDIFYPFHLEALHEALLRNSMDCIYADGWVRGAESAQPHPDVSRHIRKAPRLLAGWMHHASLHRDLLYEESVPLHWPRLTWEAWKQPEISAYPESNLPRSWKPVEVARDIYRRTVPLETRHAIDRTVRGMIGRPLPDPEVRQLQVLTAQLEALIAERVDAEKFAVDTELPAILMFNAVSWNSVTQRQHHFARGLGECGHTVFWVEPAFSPLRNGWTGRPLQQVAPGVHLLRLPAMARDIYTLEWNDATVDLMAAAIVQTFAAYGVGEAATLINYPRFQPIVNRLRERCGQGIASDCLDDQRAFAGIYQTVLSSYEDWLVEHADLLLTSSVVLQKRHSSRPTTLLHNACNYELFAGASPMGHLSQLPRPIVGFFGVLADWLDIDLIRAAAEYFPEWTFVYIGPHTFSHSENEIEWIAATNLPNIVVLPQMDLSTLAAHLAEFDVCTIPFRDMAATHAMNPVKLYEYLAAGNPVVARDLPEIRHLANNEAKGLISLYSTREEFFERLRSAVTEKDETVRARRQAFARSNDWNRRVSELSELLTALARSRG